MPSPLIPLGIAAAVAYLVFGKKTSAPPGYAPPSSPSSPSGPSYTPPSSGGGGGTVDPSGGGTYLGPGGTDTSGGDLGGGLGTDPSLGGSSVLGGAAGFTTDTGGVDPSTGTGAPGLGDFSVSGPPLVHCPEVGGWCPWYPGHEEGYPPPPGTPIY